IEMKKLYLILLFFIAYSFISAQSIPAIHKKNNLKVTILSLFSGSTKITYERYLLSSQSIEITGGIIGAGFDMLKHNHAKGALCRLAYKYIFSSKKNSLLQGWYVKPELAFSSYTYNYYNTSSQLERLSVARLAILSVGGYEWVQKWFVFDIFAGMGLGVGNANHSNYHHGYIGFNPESIFALTAGFKLGVSF
ncbi:MAG: hypothetical protein WC265_05370, partial [Dysgonamonadaceae bacterium]